MCYLSIQRPSFVPHLQDKYPCPFSLFPFSLDVVNSYILYIVHCMDFHRYTLFL